jgi:chaperone required for assembly of F1-ATPase
MKYISIAVRLDGRALLIPAGCHAAADRANADHLVRIGWLRLLTEMKNSKSTAPRYIDEELVPSIVSERMRVNSEGT